jgi:transcriptional regulator with XRE-family HTH domain
MKHEFALDLKVERRKAGLSQGDVAHLLDVHPSKVSLIEAGRTVPSLKDICALTVLYGKSFESLFYGMLKKTAGELKGRFHRMPDAPKRWLPTFNRKASLGGLAERLEAITPDHHETT